MRYIAPDSQQHRHDRHRPIRRKSAGRSASAGLLFALAAVAGLIVVAGAITALVLWPRWPAAVATDAPSVPITVGGVLFNVPPAAIRVPVQRLPGTQARLDLAFLWPSLQPPGPQNRYSPDEPPPIDRVFVTIAAQTTALSPAERVKTIYPRYLADTQYDGPDGLKLISFRDGTPYQGEDIYFDQSAQGALPGALQPARQGRHARHVPLRAPHRQCRRDGALPERMAQGLAHRVGGDRDADRELQPTAGRAIRSSAKAGPRATK